MKQYYIVIFTAPPPPAPKILQKPPTKLDIKGKKFGIQMVLKMFYGGIRFSVLHLSYDTKYVFISRYLLLTLLAIITKYSIPTTE